MCILDVLGDGISNVELLSYMGNDLMVVNAARVSYGVEEKELSEKGIRLIHYLSSHNHWTPFSHPQLQFRIKMPLFVAREWYRHTVGFTRNEVSRRYVNSTPEVYLPTELRSKPKEGQSKQGSGERIQRDIEAICLKYIAHSTGEAQGVYDSLISSGVAPEQARIVLPVGTYTEFWETASLYAYSRLCKLRIQPDAQKETRLYAEAVSSIIEPLFPISWKELTNAAISHE